MLYRVIDASELPSLVSAFMESYEVVAPVKRDRSYVFEAVESYDDIELGYDTTISSPKKYFLPPTETLFPFDARAEHEVEPVQRVDVAGMGAEDDAGRDLGGEGRHLFRAGIEGEERLGGWQEVLLGR